MRNIAIIPARSGSKGLKDKNIKNLNGNPLMYYSIQVALKSGLFSEVMVSTDSEKYAEIAEQCGANVPFLRSKITSGDAAGSWDVVKEVLSKYQEKNELFDTVCLLQPTSPLRTIDDVTNAYKLFKDKKADAITSMCEVEHSPLWTTTLPQDGSLMEYNENDTSDGPRQRLDTYYRFNGAIYIRKIEYTDSDILLLNQKEYAFIMTRENSVDIDSELDFIIAECLGKYK